MIEVEGPDGRIVEFPEGTPRDEMRRAMQRLYGGPRETERSSPLRPAGITTRGLMEGAIQGVGAIGSVPLDAAYNVVAGLSPSLDMGMPFTRGVSRVSGAAADAAGLPSPENWKERMWSAAAQGTSGALAGAGAGAALGATGRLGQLAQRTGQTLAKAPVTQGASGAVGGAATQGLSEAGADPLTAAVGGMVAGTAAAAPASSAVAARQLARPWYPAGKRNIVGGLMQEAATDVNAARRALSDVPEYVRGSQPTTAAAARDPGLIGLERGVERFGPGATDAFAQRRSQNNLVRRNLMDRVVPTEGQQQARLDARRQYADDALARLFDQGPDPDVDVAPVVSVMQGIRRSRAGARAPVRAVLSKIDDELQGVVTIDQQSGMATVPAGRLYSVRRNIADLMSAPGGRSNIQMRDGTTVNAREADRYIKPVLDEIDSAIESATPGYRAYLNEFARQSRRMDRGDIMRGIEERSRSFGTDDPMTGEPYIRLSGLKRQIQSIRASKDFNKLSVTQRGVLQRIMRDLDREQAPYAQAVRPAGSDTFQNLSTGAFIAKMLGGQAGGALPRQIAAPLQWLYRIPEQQLQDLLVEAMLDPKLGRRLLGRPTARNLQDVSSELARMFAALQSSGRASIPLAVGQDE